VNGKQWNSTLPARKTPLRAKKEWKPKMPVKKAGMARNSTIKQVGKKGKEWQACRAKLKVAFQRAGITTCELLFPGCWHDNGLGFAHTKKRRNITTEEGLREVALACNRCHDIVEAFSEDIMCYYIRNVIAARKTQPSI
jgi:hypothetical protein